MTAGTYEGYDSGTVEITLLGQTYQVVWTIESAKPEPQIMNGIGLLKRNILAVSFRGGTSRSGQRITGVVSYEIIGRDILRGTWTGPVTAAVGFEELRRIN
jgi:hypothetical protein